MKLLTVLVLCGVLFLLKATTFAAGEGELDSATVSQTHFAASDTGFAPRSKMTGINFGMNLRGDPFVTSTEFGLRNIGMNTEGYIDTWEAGFGRMSVLDRITNAQTALSHKVKAEFKGISKVISFNVVQPSGALLERVGSPILETDPELFVEYVAAIYITPADVSFENIMISEGDCPAVCDGYFASQNGDPHGENAPVEMYLVVEGKGTQAFAGDTISGRTRNINLVSE